MEANTRELVRGGRARSTAQSPEILLQVVTVELGAAEDQCLVHLELFDSAYTILSLEYLDRLRQHLPRLALKVKAIGLVHLIGVHVFLESATPFGVLFGIYDAHAMVNRIRHSVGAL